MQTSKNVKKNLKPNKRIPRISTRGYYDLETGRTKKIKNYDLYPEKFFDRLGGVSEITIVIHGLRNNKSGALAKFEIAKKRLVNLGYLHPIVGFSYDSNTKGVQYRSQEKKATNVGVMIAKKNGKNLSAFLIYVKKSFPHLKIRLIGHSLGSQVILSALVNLKNKKLVESVHIFGASIPANSVSTKKFGTIIQKTVNQKFVNYYSKNDSVLKNGFEQKLIPMPIGFCGKIGKSVSIYAQKHVHPDNHRFVSYAKVLNSFP